MKPHVRVVLVRPRNPQNIGACARAMANFGFSDLAVVDPYEPVWKETRSAPGAESIVLKAKKFSSIAGATRGFRILIGTSSFHQRPTEQAVVDLPNWSTKLKEWPAGRMAILFGSERSGLSNAELSACRAVLRIPTDAKTPSMNLAQAVAVTLYELSVRSLPSKKRMTTIDIELLIQSWIDLASAVGYPPGYTAGARAGRIRHALLGARVPAQAQQFLLSFSRWLLKKKS